MSPETTTAMGPPQGAEMTGEFGVSKEKKCNNINGLDGGGEEGIRTLETVLSRLLP
jgi:hypothetical protein